MPKELLHWVLAEQVFCGLNSDSTLKAAIAKYKNLFLIGAVILDTPSYSPFGKHSSLFLKIASELHENNLNGLSPLIRLLNRNNDPLKDYTWAFGAGIITHIIADAKFHPMIDYFSGQTTGRHKKRAIMRHRTIETALDIPYLMNNGLPYNGIFEKILRHVKIDKTIFYNLIASLYDLPSNQVYLIERALKHHSTIQKLFKKNWPKLILRLLNLFPGINFDEIIALFYSFNLSPKALLRENKIRFRHPVTGIMYEMSIYEIEENTVTETLKILNFIENHWGEDKDTLIESISHLKGPNPTTGLTRVLAHDMRYFDIETDIDKMFYG